MKGEGGLARSVCSCCCGVKVRSARKPAEFSNMGMLAHLARNGLSMLAGGLGSDNGGTPLSLKRLHNLEKPYPAVGLRFKEEEAAGSIGEKLEPDLHRLTTDDCWRLILKLGTQWPTWNGAAAPSQTTTQGVVKEKKPAPAGPLHRPQDFLELIATRALEALAQTPSDHYGKTGAGGMLAPKQTIKEVMDSKAAAETLPNVTEPGAKAPSSSLEVLAPKTTSARPRTAALTIFYDGIVNVCDNIPADKAHLIMMFAEKAGVSLNSQALLRNAKCVTPPRQPGLQKDDLQHMVSTTSTSQAAEAASPSGHGNQLPMASTSDVSTSSDDPEAAAECSNSESPAPVPSPFKFTMITTSEANSRHHVTIKPLPNARKNSLARFLDSRKRSRGTGSCSEGGSSKKQAFGDHGCCLSESNTYQEFNVSGKSPMACQDSGICANCHKESTQVPTSDAEMKDALVD